MLYKHQGYTQRSLNIWWNLVPSHCTLIIGTRSARVPILGAQIWKWDEHNTVTLKRPLSLRQTADSERLEYGSLVESSTKRELVWLVRLDFVLLLGVLDGVLLSGNELLLLDTAESFFDGNFSVCFLFTTVGRLERLRSSKVEFAMWGMVFDRRRVVLIWGFVLSRGLRFLSTDLGKVVTMISLLLMIRLDRGFSLILGRVTKPSMSIISVSRSASTLKLTLAPSGIAHSCMLPEPQKKNTKEPNTASAALIKNIVCHCSYVFWKFKREVVKPPTVGSRC